MAVTFVVNYEVKDFNIWKERFESNSENRDKAGIKATPYREVQDSNKVYVIGQAPSVEILQGMFGNPKFVELMKQAGVISEPNVVLLQNS